MVSFRTSAYEAVPWYAEIVGFFLVLLQTLFVNGLRMLGQQLGNPYGEDFIDLQIITYITMVITTTMRILESSDNNTIQSIDPSTEEDLRMRMVPIGDGYERPARRHHSKKGSGVSTLRSNSSSKSRKYSSSNSTLLPPDEEPPDDLFDYQKLGSTEDDDDDDDEKEEENNDDNSDDHDHDHDMRMIRQASVKFTRMDTRTKDWFADNIGSSDDNSSHTGDDDDDNSRRRTTRQGSTEFPRQASVKFTRMDTRTKDWFAKNAGPPTTTTATTTIADQSKDDTNDSTDEDSYARDLRLIRQASVKFTAMDARSREWLAAHGGGGGGSGRLDRTRSSSGSVVSEEIIFEDER